jgi:outer membrane lipoprotein-sorting protein
MNHLSPRSIAHGLLFAALTFAALPMMPAVAAPDLTASQVIALAVKQDGRVPFKATRSQQVTRQDSVYHAGAKVDFRDGQNYQIGITEPKEINGLNLMLDHNKLTALFPRESLVFQSDVSVAAEEIKDLIMGKLTEDPALLQANYNITVAPEMDVVALYPCYKLTLVPKNGMGAGTPPGHRIWVAKENGIVMKEERYWSDDIPAYFISQYDDLSTTRQPVIHLDVPGNVSKLRLAAGTPTTMARFTTAEEALAAGKQVFLPTVVPQGFRLKAIDVMTLYGTDIVLLRYTDGLSNMVVTYRSKPLAFVALLAGASALNLVNKISTLSYHAPNNYAIAEKGDKLVYGYGDLYQETLQACAASVPLPLEKAAANPTSLVDFQAAK